MNGKVTFWIAISLFFLFVMGVSFHFYCVKKVGHNTKQTTQSREIPKATLSRVCKFKGSEFQVDTSSCKDAILIFGFIDNGTIKSFDELYPNVKNRINDVCFLSRGGGTQAALELAKKIERYQLNTCVGEHVSIWIDEEWEIWKTKTGNPATVYCKSVCPFILMAGKERVAIGERFEIKVHHPGFTYCCLPEGKNKFNSPIHNLPFFKDDMEELVSLSEERYQKSLFEFYELAMSHDYAEEELLLVDIKELQRYQLFTKFL